MKKRLLALYLILLPAFLYAEDGYRLWLRYDKIDDPALLQSYRNNIKAIYLSDFAVVSKMELINGLKGLLGVAVPVHKMVTPSKDLKGDEFSIIADQGRITISGGNNMGILYGVFHFLRLLQTHQSIDKLNTKSSPRSPLRILNHWDNLNRSVERGYAGQSIWNWHTLPGYIDQRYIDYARANASIGINGTVLTNVNANAVILTKDYLIKCAALATVFRQYGIKVYLTARFSAPVEIGGLKDADPLNPEVQQWWKKKVDEIYQLIPDFGGFLVKANSEGQPGPQNYGRTHADGANMLADAVAPHNGIVMWRAFVYTNQNPEDRFKQAYTEFKSLDGQFRKNVLIQVKNGPIDFQPREPFSPLFGNMPKTPLMAEFQITQEYLGFSTHLVYLATLFKECLDADTYTNGEGTTVAKTLSGMAGVANIGTERNWTGHPFGQANWYAFGRLAWDDKLSASDIADEWIRQTFSNDKKFIAEVKKIMMMSREAAVNYMTPLGLHHIMGTGHHYGPAPWVSNAGRPDWNPVYYHKADSFGVGFDRTATGSNALSQYRSEVSKQWSDVNTTDEKYLLWFHHVSWDHKMRSGRTLWDELCYKYNEGVDSVKWMDRTWKALESKVDKERFNQVRMFLDIQLKEAKWWRDACLSYFKTFSGKSIPAQYEQPEFSLDHYKALRFPYAPGN